MDIKKILTTLWIFLTVNFIFCDVFTLMHSKDLKNLLSGNIDGMVITQEFLLSFAVLMEIPMLMILLSSLLTYRLNRILNVFSGVLLAIIQIWSLSVGNITLHYAFFSSVEISICLSIVVLAWRWKDKD
jgi:hypothetical protein